MIPGAFAIQGPRSPQGSGSFVLPDTLSPAPISGLDEEEGKEEEVIPVEETYGNMHNNSRVA